MRWIIRLSLLATGVVTVMYGTQMMHRGIFVYQNRWWRGTNYSPGTIAIGIFIGLLAFLPPTAWVNRWTVRKKDRPLRDHPAYHQGHHGSK